MKTRLMMIAVITMQLLVSVNAREPEEVYRHATVLEDFVGKVYIREGYEVPLTVLGDCESSNRGCPEEQVYGMVLRLDFVSEHRRAGKNEVFRSEESAGTIYAALAFSREDFETFRFELETRFRQLSAQAFMEPFAGLGPMKPGQHGVIQKNRGPFESELATPPERPTWVCYESDNSTTVSVFRRKITEGPSGEDEISRGSHSFGEPPTPLCDEMASATRNVFPTVIETLSTPRRLREIVVYYEEAVLIDSKNPAMLLPRPEGVLFFKQKASKGIQIEGSDHVGDVSYAVQVGAGWFRIGYAPTAPMPIDGLDRNVWLQRWTLETIDRELGPYPTERTIERNVLYASYLATVPAAEIDGEWSGTMSSRAPPEPPAAHESVPDRPAQMDRSGFVDEIVDRLDRHHGPPGELIEELLARPQVGLLSEGWIVVLCRQDGTSTYFLYPTKAQNAVQNADQFCFAVESHFHQ